MERRVKVLVVKAGEWEQRSSLQPTRAHFRTSIAIHLIQRSQSTQIAAYHRHTVQSHLLHHHHLLPQILPAAVVVARPARTLTAAAQERGARQSERAARRHGRVACLQLLQCEASSALFELAVQIVHIEEL